jgi:hypothetical protein
MSPFDRYRNADRNTYNAAKMMADLSGLSQAEIVWTFNRLKNLMQYEGKTKEEAQAQVKIEAADRPWER